MVMEMEEEYQEVILESGNYPEDDDGTEEDDDDDDDDEEAEKWMKHYSSRQRILLVGEGDLSFSLCLARAFGSARNMVATSLDTQGNLQTCLPYIDAFIFFSLSFFFFFFFFRDFIN
jgi:hypothetical protein